MKKLRYLCTLLLVTAFGVGEGKAQEAVLLYESWSKSSAKSDGSSELNVSSDNLDYKNWAEFVKVYQGANQCGKLGNTSAAGSMKTKPISLNGNGKLTFKIKGCSSDNGRLKVTVTGATIDGDDQFSPESADSWTECTVSIVGGGGNVVIKLATTSNRIYIDDIKLEEELSYKIECVSNNASYGLVSIEKNVIQATPAEGYRIASPAYEVIRGEAVVNQDGNRFVVDALSDCTVQINFEIVPEHTITLSVNGTETTATYKEGAEISFDVPAEVYGKHFVGWTTASIDGETNEEPSLQTTIIVGNADAVYYAVYANVASESTEQITDELTQATTGISGNAYSAWSGKTDASEAVYAGQSAGSGTGIQLRSNEKNSGIVTTKSGGSVKKVAIKWNSNTADGRTLNVYGANTAYGSAASLYGTATQGILLGTITYGTSTELNIGDDYAFVGLRSAEGALYINNILITWERVVPGAYSGFCTTLSPVVSHDRGDVNGDGSVTIADVKALVEILLGKDTEQNHYDCDAADVNRDGVRSIADVTALVSLILAGE